MTNAMDSAGDSKQDGSCDCERNDRDLAKDTDNNTSPGDQ